MICNYNERHFYPQFVAQLHAGRELYLCSDEGSICLIHFKLGELGTALSVEDQVRDDVGVHVCSNRCAGANPQGHLWCIQVKFHRCSYSLAVSSFNGPSILSFVLHAHSLQ